MKAKKFPTLISKVICGFVLTTSLAVGMKSQQARAETLENTVNLELLGRAGLYSINYDRLIVPQVAVGVGVSYWSASSYYSSTRYFVIPFYANYYFVESGEHRPFVTGGVDIIFANASNNSSLSFSGSGALATVGGGYEYRGDNGFLFRVAPYMMIGGGGVSIWLGLTGGYAF